MAIYHCSIKNISRGSGKSAVASASYRAGEKLEDLETGLIHDYTRKKEIAYSEIFLCENAPKEYQDRGTLWNAVEQIEKQSKARLAREWEVALPNELTLEQSKELVKGFAQSLVDEGMCVDANIHWKEGNHHAHIMATVRAINEKGQWAPKTKGSAGTQLTPISTGISRKVPEPFIVMATQNPKGSAGTQLLPESQLDRFMICMSMGYPSHDAEVDIAKGKSVKADEYTIKPVMNAQGLVEMQGEVEQVFIHDSIYSYIVDLVDATRTSPYIELGVSPRGTIAGVRMAKAYAYLSGRSYVIPSDVVSVFADVTKHRIVLNTKARVSHVSELSVIDEILKAVKQPTTYVKKAGNRD